MGATCLAYGVDLNLAQLVFINTSASVLSSLIPVPGGIGAAEAALSAGLIAMGVDESTAFAIAITQRLCTFISASDMGVLLASLAQSEGLRLSWVGQVLVSNVGGSWSGVAGSYCGRPVGR